MNYARNREQRIQQMRDWTDSNRERKREADRQYRASLTPEQRRQRSLTTSEWRRRRRQDPEYVAAERAYAAKRRAKNPDTFRGYEAARRAREVGAQGSHTDADWRAMVRIWDWCCAYCAATGPLERDHVIPLSLGGSNFIGNILPACHSCNCSKSDRTISEWRNGIAPARFRRKAA